MPELPTPTVRELEILKVLWEQGPSTVREVHQRLQQPDEPIAMNTIQTMLRIMETKKLVSHHVDGRSFVYTPLFSRHESASRFLERVFDGAASELMSSLLEAEAITPDELDRVHQLIAQARRKRPSKSDKDSDSELPRRSPS